MALVNGLAEPTVARFWVADAGIDKTPFARGVVMILEAERRGEGVGVDILLSYVGWRFDFIVVSNEMKLTKTEGQSYGRYRLMM